MKLSKKVMLVCLFALLSLGLVFAGGKKEEAPKTVTLKVLGYGDNASAEGEAFVRICDEFQAANPDIVLDVEMAYDDPYHQKVSTRLAANDVPHVAYMGADAKWGTPWAEADQQVDNTPYYPEWIDANAVPDFYGTGMKPYLPLGGGNPCSVVGVNMALLDEIGGKLPTTYEELVELAKLCKANGIKCMETHGAASWVWGSCVIGALIARTSGDPQWIDKAVAGEKKFTDPEFVAALQVIEDWVKDGIMSEESILVDGDAVPNFNDGKYLMYIDGAWAFNDTNFGTMADHLLLTTIPPIKNEKLPGAMCSAWVVGYGITKEATKDPAVLDAAKKFLAYFNSEEEIIERVSKSVIVSPILKEFNPPAGITPFVAKKADLNKYPVCTVVDAVLKGAAMDALNLGMQDLVAGKTTAADLAAKVQAAFDAK